MKILRASKSDTGTIVKLNFFVQKIHSEAHPNIFKPYVEDEGIKSFFEQLLTDQNNYIFLAYLSDVLVGYLWAQIQQIPETPLTYSKRRIFIHHVSVDEKYREKGVGACLMDKVKKVSKDLDIQDIAVDTWTFNKEANHFFRSQGFEIYNFRMWNILTQRRTKGWT
jgi:ribosomal protein S18 acetylase RimI-like enzyme